MRAAKGLTGGAWAPNDNYLLFTRHHLFGGGPSFIVYPRGPALEVVNFY